MYILINTVFTVVTGITKLIITMFLLTLSVLLGIALPVLPFTIVIKYYSYRKNIIKEYNYDNTPCGYVDFKTFKRYFFKYNWRLGYHSETDLVCTGTGSGVITKTPKNTWYVCIDRIGMVFNSPWQYIKFRCFHLYNIYKLKIKIINKYQWK